MDEKFNDLRKLIFEGERDEFRAAAHNEHIWALGTSKMEESVEREMIADIYRELAMIIDQHINKPLMFKPGMTIRDMLTHPNFDGSRDIKIRMVDDEGRVTDVYDSRTQYGNIVPYADEIVSYITISDNAPLVIEFEKHK